MYQKTPQRPVVGLPMATSFEECFAMDLNFYKGKSLLHLIDHATKLSVSSFIKSREPEAILNAIFKSWIQIYGAPESPFSNKLGERHNLIIADMMDKVLEESKHLDVDLTLAWCLNGKNSQANVHGFSLFQLKFGQNVKLPSTFAKKPTALVQYDTSKILTDSSPK